MGGQKGIAGMTKAFRKMMEEFGTRKKILFLGSEAVCLPFAELLAYACRDLGDSFYFAPGGEPGKAVELRYRSPYGFQTGRRVKLGKADILVVMGGLALPASGVEVEKIRRLFPSLLRKGGKVVGFSFMGVLEKRGWNRKLKFDRLLDVRVGRIRVK
ncbi:MAG: DUF2124 family protein [Candidatus Hadarchaeales archaeon]